MAELLLKEKLKEGANKFCAQDAALRFNVSRNLASQY
jgi:hypothetical protein